MLQVTDIITPHITDAHAVDYPCLRPGFVCEAELPHWAPIHIGSYALDLSPTKHVVMMIVSSTTILSQWTTDEEPGPPLADVGRGFPASPPGFRAGGDPFAAHECEITIGLFFAERRCARPRRDNQC